MEASKLKLTSFTIHFDHQIFLVGTSPGQLSGFWFLDPTCGAHVGIIYRCSFAHIFACAVKPARAEPASLHRREQLDRPLPRLLRRQVRSGFAADGDALGNELSPLLLLELQTSVFLELYHRVVAVRSTS